jgi:hypothetical protein
MRALEGNVRLRRWWNGVAGIPARALMRLTSSGLPRRSHDGMQLVVGDIDDAPSSERFFSRTVEALARVASSAPGAYADLHKDLHQIVLWREGAVPPYQKYLLAAVVPTRIAFESTTEEYAAWLLYASGIALGEQRAHARVKKFMAALDGADSTRIAEWLASVKGGPP